MTGGTLPPGAPSYVKRPAADDGDTRDVAELADIYHFITARHQDAVAPCCQSSLAT